MNKSKNTSSGGARASASGGAGDDAAGQGPEAPDRAEIEAQIARLREDMTELAQMLKSAGSARWEEARGQAEAMPEEALAELRHQLHRLEEDARTRVKAQPLQSLGLAALAGFLLGLFLRR